MGRGFSTLLPRQVPLLAPYVAMQVDAPADEADSPLGRNELVNLMYVIKGSENRFN
jgi:hypothetical protein